MGAIADNLRAVRDKMAAAAVSCGRAPEEIELLAVSKTFPIEVIREAVAAGQYHFGESRVQEAEPKIAAMMGTPLLQWHLVGHLQTNKARRAVELFDVIHSVDSVKLASKLSQACMGAGKNISVLLQVDLSREETKFGADPERIEEVVRGISSLDGLRLDGLMTIPPYFEDEELTRPYFVRLRRLRDELERQVPGCLGRRDLSMGMSHDFKVAIQEGSTIVRIGTAIFGEREHG
jgi:pyridoxal phosphate enzyme (YggS family)